MHEVRCNILFVCVSIPLVSASVCFAISYRHARGEDLGFPILHVVTAELQNKYLKARSLLIQLDRRVVMVYVFIHFDLNLHMEEEKLGMQHAVNQST